MQLYRTDTYDIYILRDYQLESLPLARKNSHSLLT